MVEVLDRTRADGDAGSSPVRSGSGGWTTRPVDFRVVGLGEGPYDPYGTVELPEPTPLNRLSVRVLCSECQRTIQFPLVVLQSSPGFPADIDPFAEIAAEATCPECTTEYEVRVAGGPGEPRTWVFRRPLLPDSRCEPYEYRIVEDDPRDGAADDGVSRD